MKNLLFTLFLTSLHLTVFSQKVGVGTTTPQNTLDVKGGMAVGTNYAGASTAPTNGLIIEGNVGIGTDTPTEALEVGGRVAAQGFKNTIYTAQGVSPITLSVINIPTDVPGLSVTFSLPVSTTVQIYYNLVLTWPNSTSIVSTKLLIDGTSYAPVAVSGSPNNFDFLANQYTLELAAGSHTVKVQYIAYNVPGYQNNPNPDFSERRLQVLVFGSN